MTKFAIRSLFLATISPLALPAHAQETQGPPAPAAATAAAEPESEQSTIIVTGTRRTDRTVAD